MPNQFTHQWKQKELDFLKENFTTLTYTEIGNHLNRSYSSVQSKIRNLKIFKRQNKHSINSHFFKVWSAEMAYILGFIAADGNIYKSKNGYHIHIASDDRDIIEKIKYVLNTTTPIREKPRFNGKTSYSLRFSDKIIFYDLINLEITPQKSLTLLPSLIPDKFLWHYSRGFFDGDGCVYISKVSCYPSRLHTIFYTASEKMAQYLFTSITSSLNYYKGKILFKKNKYYVLHFGQKHSEVIFQYMYNNATIYMQRKYTIFLEGIQKNES